ncbi:helix-turn-helix domain-containing protein [Streptomyces sp. NPDC046557]|uniref:helix-turn-helix domain-containing protein n=1 Tax=Streptomyces sp. NPDC046557 TaxID=3155372 RepID=UPI0033D55A94
MERIIEEIREDLGRRMAVAADRLADRTLAEEPAYAGQFDRAELRERIHRTLERAVAALVGVDRGLPPDPADVREAGAEGADAAERGLPLESLLRGYRRAGRLLWQTLTEAVAAHDRAALPRLLPGATALWEAVDRMSDAACGAYVQTEAGRADRDRERRAALLDALLDGTANAAGVADAAVRLGLPERGRFAVLAFGPGGAPTAAVAASGGGPRVWWRMRADGESGLVELGALPLESVRDLLAPAGARAGVSPVVESPAELAGARRLAALALRTAPAVGGPGAALLDERLPAALVAGDAELAGRLRRVVLGPVLALPPEDRRVLLTTLGTWLACQGSTTYAAQRLYCHRNTVSNRLRRLERLTGRSLSDPAQVVELALAHAAVLQHTASLHHTGKR